jgi:hypothetical protein
MAFTVRKPAKGSGNHPVWAQGITQDMDLLQREILYTLRLLEQGRRRVRTQ